MARAARSWLPSLYFIGLMMVSSGRRVMGNQPSPAMAEDSRPKLVNNWSRYVGQTTDAGPGLMYHASVYRE